MGQPRIVYVDVLFLTNFIINYVLLLCTAKLLKLEQKNGRMVGSAALGAVYAVCMFYPPLSLFFHVVFKFLFSLSMILVAFGYHGYRQFIRATASFYVVCFVFGGASFALFYFTSITNALDMILNNGIFYINLSLPMLLVFAAITFIIINYVFWLFAQKSKRQNLYLDVTLKNHGKDCTLKAFVDTGNMLKNPIDKEPVIVCQFARIKDLIPQSCWGLFDGTYHNTEMNENEAIELMMLPYSSLGQTNGVIPAFFVEKAICKNKDGMVEKEHVLVAVSQNALSTDNSYFALVNPDVITTKVSINTT